MMISDSGLLFWATLYIAAACLNVVMSICALVSGGSGPENLVELVPPRGSVNYRFLTTYKLSVSLLESSNK